MIEQFVGVITDDPVQIGLGELDCCGAGAGLGDRSSGLGRFGSWWCRRRATGGSPGQSSSEAENAYVRCDPPEPAAGYAPHVVAFRRPVPLYAVTTAWAAVSQ